MKNIKPKQMTENQIQIELESALDCDRCGRLDGVVIDLIAHIKWLDRKIERLEDDVRRLNGGSQNYGFTDKNW